MDAELKIIVVDIAQSGLEAVVSHRVEIDVGVKVRQQIVKLIEPLQCIIEGGREATSTL